MNKALIFDIKEFGLHDGRGMRTTVFFKGCPLKCLWCHNPEGISAEQEVARNESKCSHCGLCRRKCNHPDCIKAGVCLHICPNDLVKLIGREYSCEELAEKLKKNEIFLKNGGVTFSGGEPLLQIDFIVELIKMLNVKTAVETCGFVNKESFKKAIDNIDDIFIDIKHIDPETHKKFTGQDNKIILENIEMLKKSEKPFTVRTPLIPGLTDTNENLYGIANFLKDAKNVSVELIPYNRMTGAKYRAIGKEYDPPFDENQKINKNTLPYKEAGIKCIAY